MILNKENKIKYLGKLLELVKTSYSELGSIYNVDEIETFDAGAVKKKYERIIHIIETMKTVVEGGEFDQFNETSIRVFYKNQNMFTLEVDGTLFQDFNLVNYFGIPTFDFMNIINSFIYNESVVKINSYAEYLNSDEGRTQIKAAIEAQENDKKQKSMINNISNMTQDDVRKFMELISSGNINNTPNNVTPNRFGPSTAVQPTVETAEVVGQNLTPTSVKPVGGWK